MLYCARLGELEALREAEAMYAKAMGDYEREIS